MNDATMFFPVYERPNGDRLVFVHRAQRTMEDARDPSHRDLFFTIPLGITPTDDVLTVEPGADVDGAMGRLGPFAVALVAGPTFDATPAR